MSIPILKMQKRFPDFGSALSVFSLIVFLVYSWTIVTFFWKIPSWLFYLTPGEIGVIFSYSMSVAFFESAFWLAVLLAVSFVLPSGLFRDHFVERAGWFITIFLGSLAVYLVPKLAIQASVKYFYQWFLLAFASALLLTALSTRLSFMQKMILALSERITVFLLLYLPLSAISLLFILFRFIFPG
jgi:hypothetical protein